MKKHAMALNLFLTLASVVAMAQPGPRTPSPEVKKLDYFTGNWTIDATIPSGPWGSGGKFTSSGNGEWMKGDFFVMAHTDFSLPPDLGGSGTGIAVFGYDADKKTYTEDRFDSLGQHVVVTGTVNGDTWTWTGQNVYGGMTINTRMTMKVMSPTSYTSKYEVSSDGGANWMTFWEGKGTKK